jgi:hypothetical protein
MYLKLKRVGEITARTKRGLFQICIFLYNFDIHATNFNELNLLILILEEISFSNVKSENDISITQFRDESRRLHHM